MAGPRRSRKRRAAPRRPARRKAPGLAIAILSRNPRLYSTRRLVEAARALGHRPEVLDTLRLNPALSRDHPAVFHRGEELPPPDVVVPRIGASITHYALAVLSQLELMGVPVLAGAAAVARSRDKMRALQLLSRFGLDVPRTVMCRFRDEVPHAVEQVGGLPCIVKLLQGTQGVGVMIASSMAEVHGMLDTFWDLGQEILLQEFVRESKGRDVRALVIGDRVVAAMRRRARTGEFRSNIHRGGKGTPLTLSRAYAEAAVKAARVIGLEVAGVDVLEARTGPMIMEVNSSPGFEGLERVTGRDIARLYVERAAELARARPGAPGGLERV